MEYISIIGFFAIGIAAVLFLSKRKGMSSDEVIKIGNEKKDKARVEAEVLRKSALQKIDEMKNSTVESEKSFNEFLEKIEESIKSKEEVVAKRELKNDDLRAVITKENEEKAKLQAELKKIDEERVGSLEKRAQKNALDIKKELVQSLENELTEDNERKLKKLEEYYKENAEKEARNTVLSALQRLSTATSNEKKGSQLKVVNDLNKPNVVGMNAENIIFLEEQLDNVDIIFNDFPGIVTISHYNLITRHITKKTLDKLFSYRGPISKATVTAKIEEAKKDVDRELLAIGRDALRRINIKRVLPDECLQVIGRLQFRTSYGQNIMRHSYEVGIFALMMAYELGLDIETAKISGFLHDLGKAIDQNPDIIGAHDFLTKELMEKYACFQECEIHAAWTHHDSEPPKTPEAFLVKGADAISAGRPGARAESLDRYVERLNALQDIAMSYEGVDKVSAMSAGRELRVLVSPGSVHDKEMQPLADVIASEIKEKVAYPGYVRVNIIRTTKSADIARPRPSEGVQSGKAIST